MKLIGLMEGHLPAFEDKAVLIGGTDHLPLIDIDHLPKIMAFPIIFKIFGKFHIKDGDDLFNINVFLKAQSCKIIFHLFSPLADFTLIITNITFFCKEGVGIIEL